MNDAESVPPLLAKAMSAREATLDDIIDPAETRDLIARLLATFPAPAPREGRKHPIDPW